MTKYDVAAQVTLAGIEGKAVKLTAAQQRAIFGGYVFGRATIQADCTGQGKVTISKNAGHSDICRDTLFAEYSFAQVAQAVTENRKLQIV